MYDRFAPGNPLRFRSRLAWQRITIMAGAVLAVSSTARAAGPVTLVSITPCRIVDTRAGYGFSGQYGPPALMPGANRTFQITGTTAGTPIQCGIPDSAVAVEVNVTVADLAGGGDIRIFPAGAATPTASILNYQLENIANSTTVALGPSGGGHNGITVRDDYSGTDLIIDVMGYYLPVKMLSGQTLTGTYAIEYTAAAPGNRGISAITFPFQLASAPSAPGANVIPAGGTPTANCPGSAGNPLAAPGNLCVYETFAVNIGFRCIAETGASYLCGQAEVFGSSLFVTATAAGQTSSTGTWAVTIP
jgi:hypothetical protein